MVTENRAVMKIKILFKKNGRMLSPSDHTIPQYRSEVAKIIEASGDQFERQQTRAHRNNADFNWEYFHKQKEEFKKVELSDLFNELVYILRPCIYGEDICKLICSYLHSSLPNRTQKYFQS